MQIPLLHQQILLQTERLRDLHRNIMLHASPVPAAEIENLLKEIRSLYELTLQLNNENAIQLFNEVQLAVNQIIPQQQKPHVLPAESISQAPVANEKVENTVVQNSEKLRIPDAIAIHVQPQEKKQPVTELHNIYHESNTIADRFEDQPTLGERIAFSQTGRRVSDNLRKNVSDLKSAIGINEKFQFINQLFNGDAGHYNQVVEKINSSDNLEMAMNQVKELADSNHWESHAHSAKSFIDIIERRFSA